MMRIDATQERGWVAQFPDTTVAGKWRWSLLGPAPQKIEEDTGAGVRFDVDESVAANRGNYAVSLQRLDSTGGSLGDSQVSSIFVIDVQPPVFVDIEIAGPVTVGVSKV